MSNIIQKHLVISGRVQGVGFRFFVKRQAEKLGIIGWVKNKTDGRVELVIAGKKIALEEMTRLIKKGPSWARVDNIIEENEVFQGEFQGFKIR